MYYTHAQSFPNSNSYLEIYPGYLLPSALERSTIFNRWTIYFYGPFSMAMLNNQMVMYNNHLHSTHHTYSFVLIIFVDVSLFIRIGIVHRCLLLKQHHVFQRISLRNICHLLGTSSPRWNGSVRKPWICTSKNISSMKSGAQGIVRKADWFFTSCLQCWSMKQWDRVNQTKSNQYVWLSNWCSWNVFIMIYPKLTWACLSNMSCCVILLCICVQCCHKF